MASEMKTVATVILKGSNCDTWKVQCRMELVKGGLWSIVSGSEAFPSEDCNEKGSLVGHYRVVS